MLACTHACWRNAPIDAPWGPANPQATRLTCRVVLQVVVQGKGTPVAVHAAAVIPHTPAATTQSHVGRFQDAEAGTGTAPVACSRDEAASPATSRRQSCDVRHGPLSAALCLRCAAAITAVARHSPEAQHLLRIAQELLQGVAVQQVARLPVSCLTVGGDVVGACGCTGSRQHTRVVSHAPMMAAKKIGTPMPHPCIPQATRAAAQAGSNACGPARRSPCLPVRPKEAR